MNAGNNGGKEHEADHQEIQREQLVRSDVHLCDRMGMFDPLPSRRYDRRRSQEETDRFPVSPLFITPIANIYPVKASH